MTQTMFPSEILENVLKHAGDDWREQAVAVVRNMRGEATGEDIRLECLARDIAPHHSNAWGGFIGWLIRDGVLAATGRYVPMKAKDSHARKTPVYRIAGK